MYRNIFRLVLLILGVLAILSFCGAQDPALLPAKGVAGPQNVVLFLGDSMTAGYGVIPDQNFPALINGYWQARGISLTGRNAGISGNTTTDVLARLDQVLTPDVCFVFLQIGNNDAFRGKNVPEIKANIAQILHRIREKRIPAALAAMSLPPRFPEEKRQAFFNMYEELSKENQIPWMFLISSIMSDEDYWLPHMHPSESGHRVIARDVLRFLNNEWEYPIN